jgi:tetratricopeptide (TPR) repeat protein
MRRSRAVISAFLAVLLIAPHAAAQPADDDPRAKARVIGQEGLAFFDQGMYIDALDRFERADAIIKAPTLGLMAARSLEKLGRFVEASERYLQVVRMTLDPKASDVWKQAVASAAKEREALLPRIPSIEIALEGPGAGDAAVRIDGRAVPKAIIGIKTPIDPGAHRIDARSPGGTGASERVNLAEGQSTRVVLTLSKSGASSVPDAAAPGSAESPGANVMGSGLAGAGAAGAASTPSATSPSAMALGSAGAPDEQTRAVARAIGEEGLSLYDQGRYVDALDRFERADDLIKAPTLGLMAARSLERLGRLVEASNRYQQVTDAKLAADAPDSFKQAQATAAKERETLTPRIPTVDVSVEGPGAAEVSSLMLDGRRVSPSYIGSARPIASKIPVDPGDHRLEAKATGGEAFERFTVNEGGTERVVLTLTGSPNKALLPPGKDNGKSASEASPKDEGSDQPPERRGKGQRTAAFVSLGVGAAGVALGVITGSVAASKKGDFTAENGCNEDTKTCPRTLADDVNTYNALRYVSGTGFIVGGIGLATGAVLLLTLPRGGAQYSTGGITITPLVGPTSAGIRGSF